MYDYKGSDSIMEAGGVTKALGESLQKQRENDAAFRQLQDAQWQHTINQAMDVAKNIPTGIGPDTYKAEGSLQYLDAMLERNWNDTMRNMNEIKMWSDGVIALTMAGGPAVMDYLIAAPTPKFETTPMEDFIAQHPQVGEQVNGLNQTLELVPTANEDNIIPDTEITTFVDDTMPEIQGLWGGLLNELNGILTPTGEGTKETRETNYEDVAADALRAVFTPEVLGRWGNMTVDQKGQYITAYTGYLCNAMGIDIKHVNIYDMGTDIYGQRTRDNNIELNLRIVDSADPAKLGRVLDTIIHETRHQFQAEAANDPERFGISQETANIWKNNFENYVSPMDDLEGYWKQPIEQDAQGFAEDVMTRAGLGIPVGDQISLRRDSL